MKKCCVGPKGGVYKHGKVKKYVKKKDMPKLVLRKNKLLFNPKSNSKKIPTNVRNKIAQKLKKHKKGGKMSKTKKALLAALGVGAAVATGVAGKKVYGKGKKVLDAMEKLHPSKSFFGSR